jgi:hypothetical protein
MFASLTPFVKDKITKCNFHPIRWQHCKSILAKKSEKIVYLLSGDFERQPYEAF